MEYRPLGHTEINVSTVAFGSWGIGGGMMWEGEIERSAALRSLHGAFDAGVTLFDTAPAYGEGRSEELLGEAFADRRSRVVIATKVSPPEISPERVRPAVEESLRRLRTDYLDLLQQHWPADDGRDAEVLAEMFRLQEEGKVRAVGVSNFGPAELRSADAAGPCVTNQLPYSLLFRAVEFEIVPAAAERGMGILAYSALLHGLLAGKFSSPEEVPDGRARTRHFSTRRRHARHGEEGHEEATFAALRRIGELAAEAGLTMKDLALAWLLHQPQVTAVLAGARSPEQAADNARAADIRLSPELLGELAKATDPLKEEMGPNPDMWQRDSRVRYGENGERPR
jgi:aryl-alcohol dehydrogenase-like predicted oxidoreductase